MTEIMPVPRNLNFTVLPAGGFKPQLFCRKAEKSRLMNQTAIFPQRAGKE